MVEGGVDHTIGSGSTTAQTFQIIERAAMYGGACRAQRRCSGVRAREAEHLMSGIEQFFDDGCADKPGRAGDEDTHGGFLEVLGRGDYGLVLVCG